MAPSPEDRSSVPEIPSDRPFGPPGRHGIPIPLALFAAGVAYVVLSRAASALCCGLPLSWIRFIFMDIPVVGALLMSGAAVWLGVAVVRWWRIRPAGPTSGPHASDPRASMIEAS